MISRRVLNTLLYSDIFNYPLKKEEIWRYLISPQKISKSDFLKELINEKDITSKKNFYFLKGREKIVDERIRKEKISLEKIKKAEKIALSLSRISSIKLIAISGSLALKNSNENEDIDFFIITSKNTLWATRFFAVIALLLMNSYRRRGDKSVRNKICLNMLIDEDFLEMPNNRQELYTAHEISQLYPLVQRNSTYLSFQKANSWVLDFLPNAYSVKWKTKKVANVNYLVFVLQILEPIFKFSQKLYMKGHITKEEIDDNFLAFHPRDYKKIVLNKYDKVTTRGH